MNDIKFFSKHIDSIGSKVREMEQQIQSPTITKELLTQYKTQTEKYIAEMNSFDDRFRALIDKKRNTRALTAAEESALEEFSKKRLEIITDLNTELTRIEKHALMREDEPVPENVPVVAKVSSPKNKTVKKQRPTSPKNTTRAKSPSVKVGKTEDKKSKAPAKKDTKDDKEREKQEKLLEKEREKELAKQVKLLEKEREKQAKLLAKEQEKEREKQAKLLEKEREKQAKLLEKEREKQAKLLEKEREKQEKLLAKGAIKTGKK